MGPLGLGPLGLGPLGVGAVGSDVRLGGLGAMSGGGCFFGIPDVEPTGGSLPPPRLLERRVRRTIYLVCLKETHSAPTAPRGPAGCTTKGAASLATATSLLRALRVFPHARREEFLVHLRHIVVVTVVILILRLLIC